MEIYILKWSKHNNILSAGHRWDFRIFPKEDELNKKIEYIAAFNRMAVNRELKMIELKKEKNSLLKESSREPRYEKLEEKTSEGIK